jgi:hypothetical protein
LFPAADLLDDGIGVGGPDERLGIIVGLRLEPVDGSLEVGDPCKDAALEPASGQLGKKALDRVEPGGRGRGEVELKALLLFAFDGLAMAIARFAHFGMLIVGAGMMFVVALVLKRLVIASIFFFCV